MPNVLERVFRLSQFKSRLEREQAVFIYGILVIALIALTLYSLFVPNHTMTIDGQKQLVPLLLALPQRPDLLPLMSVYPILLVAFLALRSYRMGIARLIVSVIIYVIVTYFPATGADTFGSAVNILALLTGAITVSLLNGVNGIIGAFGVTVVLFWTDRGAISDGDAITIIVLFVALAFITYAFVRFAQLSREEGESVASLERVKLAEVTTQLTRQGSQRVSMNDALNGALKLIQDNYLEFYHAQVFLIEETGVQARLVASTGEVGQQLLARGHSLAVGSLSVIGQTTFKGEPVVVNADSRSTSYRPNDLLPNTKTEASFPIRVGERIIGALDLQSTQLLTLGTNDISTYQSLADSLALVIDNIRQFEGARARVEENQQLAEQARNALSEVQRLNKRLIGRAWTDYLKDHQESMGLSVDFVESTEKIDPEWTDTLQQAIQADGVVITGNMVSVPLKVRGQVIGAMEVEVDDGDKVSKEDLDLMQEVSERFGLAAENSRLIEQSQRAAQREALINVVSSRLQTTNNVESTLAEAARSLSDLLQAERVVIRLGKPTTKTAPIRQGD